MWVKEQERTLPAGDCPSLGWEVQGHEGHGMAELLRQVARARGPSSFHPRIESTPPTHAALGPKSENSRWSVLVRGLRTIQASPPISHKGKLRPIEIESIQGISYKMAALWPLS